MTMDTKSFEAELKREGYEVATSTTPGAKVNPEHTHPFDVKGLVLEGVFTLTCDGKTDSYQPGEVFTMARNSPHYESYGPEGAVVLVGRRK
ncbi:MAG: cupin domain-containing protein [Alphaproteobacteria bacterium]|nr:cupin domain-containing protein [Alphaproteobacteria bacterium]